MSPSVQGLLQRSVPPAQGQLKVSEPHPAGLMEVCVGCRQGVTPGGVAAPGDQLQEALYPSRGQYQDRPWPVGGSTSTASTY